MTDLDLDLIRLPLPDGVTAGHKAERKFWLIPAFALYEAVVKWNASLSVIVRAARPFFSFYYLLPNQELIHWAQPPMLR